MWLKPLSAAAKLPHGFAAGVIFFWRGIWTMCDTFLGSSLPLDLASVLIGLGIMGLIKFLKLPLAESLPGT